MVSLRVFRKRDETDRFQRLRHDDTPTAIPAPAADALAADLRLGSVAAPGFVAGMAAYEAARVRRHAD